jgi:hypothetical protein
MKEEYFPFINVLIISANKIKVITQWRISYYLGKPAIVNVN